ncbi:MAG: hypothetical protein HYV47_01360 [Candidatus Nealsonbacteria bacterium]|nr:hypothetical protein [Candidatus Nealsonbacteria bacterium]
MLLLPPRVAAATTPKINVTKFYYYEGYKTAKKRNASDEYYDITYVMEKFALEHEP